jgi:protein gp37
MNRTGIEWTDFSANPLKYKDAPGKVVWGCVKTSPGCQACYAEALAKRYGRGGPFTAAQQRGLTPFLDEAELRKMLTYKPAAGKRCFVGDMTDVFGAWVPESLLNRLFSEVLEVRTDVTWQLLTKRADRMCEYLSWRWGKREEGPGFRIPARNIHVGVSVEDQRRADERIPHLLRTPAAVRFLSCEPLLSAADVSRYLYPWPNGARVGWVIVGCESGPRRRPMELAWARSLAGQCREAGVAFFMKQMEAGGKVIGDIEKFPEDLKTRDFPGFCHV